MLLAMKHGEPQRFMTILAACTLAVWVLMSSGCTSDEEIEQEFENSTTSEQEETAVTSLEDRYIQSHGRFSYSCYCVSGSGAPLSFEDAIEMHVGGKEVQVAIRLFDEEGFGPEPVRLETFWHRVIDTNNLRHMLNRAFTFSEIGDSAPAQPQ